MTIVFICLSPPPEKSLCPPLFLSPSFLPPYPSLSFLLPSPPSPQMYRVVHPQKYLPGVDYFFFPHKVTMGGGGEGGEEGVVIFVLILFTYYYFRQKNKKTGPPICLFPNTVQSYRYNVCSLHLFIIYFLLLLLLLGVLLTISLPSSLLSFSPFLFQTWGVIRVEKSKAKHLHIISYSENGAIPSLHPDFLVAC